MKKQKPTSNVSPQYFPAKIDQDQTFPDPENTLSSNKKAKVKYIVKIRRKPSHLECQHFSGWIQLKLPFISVNKINLNRYERFFRNFVST
jgi:hypothetical protein